MSRPIIGLSFFGRNWLLLVRLARMGFHRERAIKMVKRMEKTEDSLNKVMNKEMKNVKAKR